MHFKLYCTPEERKILDRTISISYIEKMLVRILISHYKYETNLKKAKQDPVIHRNELKNAEFRIKRYKDTGNPEYLVDAGNFLNIEYKEMMGEFFSTDDDPESKLLQE